MISIEQWTSLDAHGFAVLRILLAVLWQSSILFLAIAAVTWMLRKRRASARHAVWLAALILAPLFPLLCYDITWNEGVIKPITMIAPEGTIVNCIRPAPVSVATVGAIVATGAKPVFVDIRPDTLNLDEALVAQAITEKTRAIVPVHYAGVSCEMDELLNAVHAQIAAAREGDLERDARGGSL